MGASLGAVWAAAAAVGSDVVISWGQLSGMQQGKKMLMIMLSAPPLSLLSQGCSPALIMKKCIVFAAINGAIASLHAPRSSFGCCSYPYPALAPVPAPASLSHCALLPFFGSSLSSIHR